jgi:hypothetical protein
MLGDRFHYFPPRSYAFIPPRVVHATACELWKGTNIHFHFPLGIDHVSRDLVKGATQLGNKRITDEQQAGAFWYPNDDAPCSARVFYPSMAKRVDEGGVAVNMEEFVNIDGTVSAGNIDYAWLQGIAEHTHGDPTADPPIPGHELIYIEGRAQFVTALDELWCVSNGFVFLDTPHSWRCGPRSSFMWWMYFTDRRRADRHFTKGPQYEPLTKSVMAGAKRVQFHEA